MIFIPRTTLYTLYAYLLIGMSSCVLHAGHHITSCISAIHTAAQCVGLVSDPHRTPNTQVVHIKQNGIWETGILHQKKRLWPVHLTRLHLKYNALFSTLAFLECTFFYRHVITMLQGRKDFRFPAFELFISFACSIAFFKSVYKLKHQDCLVSTFIPPSSNNPHATLQEATSIGLNLGLPIGNDYSFDTLRKHAALSNIHATNANCWWTPLPPRLADTFSKGRVNFLGFELFNAPVATLNMDELPSLAESIQRCQDDVDSWAEGALTAEDPSPMNVTRYKMPGTLGQALFASLQRSRAITDRLNVPPFSLPCLLLNPTKVFHFTLRKDGSTQEIICSSSENADLWKAALPELSDIQPLDPHQACGSRQTSLQGHKLYPYEYPLSGWLTFPIPKQYQGHLALQQFHAVLSHYTKWGRSPFRLYFLPSHLNIPVTTNSSAYRARIQNTLMTHIGTLNYDIIEQQFPDFATALDRFRQDPITLPHTVSRALLGLHGAAEITKQFALSKPLPPLIHAYFTPGAYCMAITTPHDTAKKFVLLTDFHNIENNLIEQLNNGNHLVSDHEREEKDAHDTAPHETFWTDPPYAYKEVSNYLQSSGQYLRAGTTYAEATSTALPHLIPPSYKGDRERLRLHSALSLFCRKMLDTPNTILHIPPSYVHRIEENFDGSETDGIKKVRFGNIVLAKYTFDWAQIQARYPTLLDATQAAQKRMFRWLSDPAHPQAYPPFFYLLPPSRGDIPAIGAVLTGHLTRTEGHSWFPAFDFQLPSLSDRLSVPPNWPDSRHTHDPEIAFMEKINGKKTLDEHCSCALCEIDLTNHCAKYLHRDVVFTVISYVFTPTRSQN